MADIWLQDSTRQAKAALIDTTVPNAARVIDYLQGGRNNFEADRRAASRLTAAAPAVAAIVPASRAFRRRAVRHLVVEAGIRQFLDVGAGLNMTGNIHEVAQSLAPACRVVYAESDPMVLSHARSLLTSTADGTVSLLDAGVRDTRGIVAGAADTLDLGRPVAVMFPLTLGFILDTEAAAGVISSLLAAVPSGSYVTISHMASDLDPSLAVSTQRWNAMSRQKITLRSHGQLTQLLAGLDLDPPGLVSVADWRPALDDPSFGHPVPVYGAVARKP